MKGQRHCRFCGDPGHGGDKCPDRAAVAVAIAIDEEKQRVRYELEARRDLRLILARLGAEGLARAVADVAAGNRANGPLRARLGEIEAALADVEQAREGTEEARDRRWERGSSLRWSRPRGSA